MDHRRQCLRFQVTMSEALPPTSGVTALRRIRRTQPSADEFIDALEAEGSTAFSMILRRKAMQLVRSSGRSDYSLVQRRSWGSPYEYTHHPTDQDQVGRLPCPD
jgi:hypothetical protein